LDAAFLGVVAAVLYPFASAAVEISQPASEDVALHLTRNQERRRKLAGLFSLDAFGGGFLTDALVAYWFFRRFGVPEQDLGVLFFAVHLLNAASISARLVGTPDRPGEYHGLYSPAFQPVPGRCGFRAFAQGGGGAVPLP